MSNLKKSAPRIRYGIRLNFPVMPEGYYVSGSFAPTAAGVSVTDTGRRCDNCAGNTLPGEAWNFQNVPGWYCANCSPAAEARSLEFAPLREGLAHVANSLGRLLPRDIRKAEPVFDAPQVRVIDEALEIIRSSLLLLDIESRLPVLRQIWSAINSAEWDSLPEADPAIQDKKAAAVNRIERLISEIK